MRISDEQKNTIKQYLQRYVEGLGITFKNARCRCPVHMGDSGKTAQLDTRKGVLNGTPTLLHCPKCNQTWDVITLHAQLNRMDVKRDFVSVCEQLSGQLGIRLDQDTDRQPKQYMRRVDAIPVEEGVEAYQAKKTKAQAYLAECSQHLDMAKDYLAKRGISIETARRFGLGYDENYLIIPTGDGYVRRNINQDCAKGDRYRKASGLTPRGIAWGTLQSGEVCWVVEGEIDALSLFEAGQIAAGLGGIGAIQSFCKVLESRADFTTNPPKLILALDADDEGQKAQRDLESWLKAKGTPYAVLESTWRGVAAKETVKDANDALMSMGLDAFRAAIQGEVLAFKDQKEKERARYVESNVAGRMLQFWRDAQNAESAISTGFRDIDSVLGGGLRPGLYVFGAIPSLGKTALVLQIANDIAARGLDVLYFSLEMPASDLVWRSISRLSYLKDRRNALSQRDLQFEKWENLGERQQNALDAYEEYTRTAANRLWIQESIGGLGVGDIEVAIANHKAMMGRAPVVVVDYLQILKPTDAHMTDKAALDQNALYLKQLSNKYQCAMMIISSFNRANYSSEAGFESFKESGAIEYCADCLFALQFKAAIDAKQSTKGQEAQNAAIKEAIKKAKSGDIREIEFVVLKNRMGRLTGDRGIIMSFTPKFNHFESKDDEF